MYLHMCQVLRALIACSNDWHQNRWGSKSTAVKDIASLLGTDSEQVSDDLRGVNIPTTEELDKYWFADGGINTMLKSTATFLLQQNKISATALYGPAINRTYFDAAINFSPPVHLDQLLRKTVHLALLLDMSDSGARRGIRIAGAAALAVDRVAWP